MQGLHLPRLFSHGQMPKLRRLQEQEMHYLLGLWNCQRQFNN
jgi:hypothetical protein